MTWRIFGAHCAIRCIVCDDVPHAILCVPTCGSGCRVLGHTTQSVEWCNMQYWTAVKAPYNRSCVVSQCAAE